MSYNPLETKSTPLNWKRSSLYEVCTFISRGKQPKYVDHSQIYALNQKSIRWGEIQIENLKFQNPDINISEDFFVKKNDVVLNSTGTGTVGRAFHFAEKPEIRMLVDSHVTIIRTNEKILRSAFLYYQFSDYRYQKYINEGLLAGSTGQVELNKSKVTGMNILIPSVIIQDKIIGILSPLDKKIELNNQLIKILEEMTSTLFNHWFIDFEFPDKNGNPYKSNGGKMIESEFGEIPEGWKVDNFGKFIDIKSGKRPAIRSDSKTADCNIPIVGASKIMGYTDKQLINESVLVTGRVGTHGIIQRFNEPIWISDNSFIITSKYEGYVYQIMKNINYSSLNRGTSQPLITQSDLKGIKIVLPNSEMLLNYSVFYQEFVNKIESLKKENETLKELRDTLLPKLLSGEIELE